jgi:acetylornithine deacetylase/succinyl-diaminopimelate desuccinylase-like protein
LCSASVSYNALLRTTAVATQIAGGHAENALPQRATAIVNCRILPEESPDEVLATIVRVLQNDQIEVTKLTDPLPSPSSPLDPAIFQVVEHVTMEMWPGVLVLPAMSAYGSDGLHVRSAGIPVYGVSGMFFESEDLSRAHGQNERIAIASFFDGIVFMCRLMKALISAE